jgi:hypothetical protein
MVQMLTLTGVVPGGIELATVYVTGFNAGYFTASAIRSQVEGAR